MNIDILQNFDVQQPLYNDYTTCIDALLCTLIGGTTINPQSITFRVKDRTSLQNKLERPDKDYADLSDITDLCGVRVITYFKEDVDSVASLLENEFLIDKDNSTDKRIYEDPDRFGYQSLHYVISLSENRRELAEYRRFSELKAEIQIRTVIQHAWAEIEHDLGYKTDSVIPKPVKRRFFRLAAMLEVADDEFSEIKSSISSYEHTLTRLIQEDPKQIYIDNSSLANFITNNQHINACENRFAEAGNLTIIPYNSDILSRQVSLLQFAGLATIDDLSKSYEKHAADIFRILNSKMLAFRAKTLLRGCSLLHLVYAIILANADDKQFHNFFKLFDFAIQGKDEVDAFVRGLRTAIEE